MKCPSCDREFFAQPDRFGTYWADKIQDSRAAVSFLVQLCPACSQPIVIMQEGEGVIVGKELMLDQIASERVVYPPVNERVIPSEVPEGYRNDFLEAQEALQYSPKASAALSRRLLQRTLHEQLKIKRRDLSQEIEEFITNTGAPSYLTAAVDAVRHIGNFAAHPLKSTSTGEIVGVEEGEAEWLIQVIESLFDYVFVQPARLTARRDSLNAKLVELGKPPLKG